MATILSRKPGGGGGGGGAPSGPAGGFLTGTYPNPGPPSWWTVDDTLGSETVNFAGRVEIGGTNGSLEVEAGAALTAANIFVSTGSGLSVDADGSVQAFDDSGNTLIGAGAGGAFIGNPAIYVDETNKLGFFGATPVAQIAVPTTLNDVITGLQDLGLFDT